MFSRSNVPSIIENMLGHKLITKQTSEKGINVKKVMVAESVNIKRETYFCILLDRQQNGPVIVASPAGGMDIEAVAEKTPHLLKTLPVDIFEGRRAFLSYILYYSIYIGETDFNRKMKSYHRCHRYILYLHLLHCFCILQVLPVKWPKIWRDSCSSKAP